MKKSAQTAASAFLLLASGLVGCGSAQALFGKRSSAAPGASPAPAPVTVASTHPLQTVQAGGELKTTLAVGTVLPSQLKASSLRVAFESNDPAASFDCQTDARRGFVPCNAGSSYDFGRLALRQSYSLSVRAHAADGRVDAHPLLLAFTTDMLGGTAPTLPGVAGQSLSAAVTVPQSVADLPTASGSGAAGRSLQVGSYYALTVPASAVVTGYSSDKTYNAVPHIMQLLPAGGTILGGTVGCTASYQRVTQGGAGLEYCDSTPPSLQATASVPSNYIEITLNPTAGSHEAMLVEALDGAAGALDPVATRLSIAGRCQGAVTGGQSSLPLLNQFYGQAPVTQSLVWCFTRPLNGKSQWLAMLVAPLTAGTTGPSVRVIYALDAGPNINTVSLFTAKVSQAILQLVTPIAPVVPSA